MQRNGAPSRGPTGLGLLIGLVAGVAIGLLIGWVIMPVNWTPTAEDVAAMADAYDANPGNLAYVQTRLAGLSKEDQTRIFADLARQRTLANQPVPAKRVTTLAQVLGLQVGSTSARTTVSGLFGSLTPLLILLLVVVLLAVAVVIFFVKVLPQFRTAEPSVERAPEPAKPTSTVAREPAAPKPELKLARPVIEKPVTPRVETPPPAPAPTPGLFEKTEPWVRIEPPPKATPPPKVSPPAALAPKASAPATPPPKAPSPAKVTPPAKAPSADKARTLGKFVATYTLGNDNYDTSFSLETPKQEFLGECGMGVSEVIGEGKPDKVTAFDLWLFDKADVHTVTQILMSEHAFNDSTLRGKLASKGAAVLAEKGQTIILDTQSLHIDAHITELVYATTAGLPPKSHFEKLTVELRAGSKEAVPA